MTLLEPVSGKPIDVAPVRHGVRSALGGVIAEWQLTWRERRHAARVSKELLARYRAVAANHPDLQSRELYQLLVMQRTGCDSTTAKAILESARESYADWPARRELTLCDVVHYLSATEFLAAHEDQQWIHSNLTQLIASHVPRNLCISRLIN